MLIDYEARSVEVTFPPSFQAIVTMTLYISITDDTALEPTEQFDVFLNSSLPAVLIEPGTSTARVNIIDDDSKLCM